MSWIRRLVARYRLWQMRRAITRLNRSMREVTEAVRLERASMEAFIAAMAQRTADQLHDELGLDASTTIEFDQSRRQ